MGGGCYDPSSLFDLEKAYATFQEQCDILRGVFGEWQLDTFVENKC